MRVLLLGVALLALATAAGAAQARDQIRIVGSSTMFPFTTAVAEQFGRRGGFKTPVVESTGTGGGMRLFCAGIGERFPDFADASRRIKPSEHAACQRNGVGAIAEIMIGSDGIVLANSKAGPGFALTLAQLWQALAKEVPQAGQIVPNPFQRWRQIDPGLPDERIEVLGPPPTSGTRDSLAELGLSVGCQHFAEIAALADAQARQAACQTVREDGAYVEAGENDNLIVRRLRENPGAVGIFGYSFLAQSVASLQAASLEGVRPDEATIRDGSYPLARGLYLYVKTAHVGLVPGMREFLAEYLSPAAMGEDGYLAAKGLVVPLPSELARLRTAAELLPALAM
ncbi:MAG: substrate-binding domain-containing protein [Geminicoccaceae bacterium]